MHLQNTRRKLFGWSLPSRHEHRRCVSTETCERHLHAFTTAVRPGLYAREVVRVPITSKSLDLAATVALI